MGMKIKKGLLMVLACAGISGFAVEAAEIPTAVTENAETEEEAAAIKEDKTQVLRLDISQGNIVIEQNGSYLITGSTDTNTIKVEEGVTADIELMDTTIDVAGQLGLCAFEIERSSVTLSLTGANVLKSGDGKAGLAVPVRSSLVILGGSGSLQASGGMGGAGIGGSNREACGEITINNNADITASGGMGGAGIGGGDRGAGGRITINNNADITAVGGEAGAGIGGGSRGASGVISINNNADVTAAGGTGGAGIGGGDRGAGYEICIQDNAEVISNGGSDGAGIGGGNKGASGSIHILGGTVAAETAGNGAGIGGGMEGAGVEIEIAGGVVEATGSAIGADVGNGGKGQEVPVSITGGMVSAGSGKIAGLASYCLENPDQITELAINGEPWNGWYGEEAAVLWLDKGKPCQLSYLAGGSRVTETLTWDPEQNTFLTSGNQEEQEDETREEEIKEEADQDNPFKEAVGSYILTEEGTYIFTIEPEDGAEYSADGVNWQEENVFENIQEGETKDFYIRKKEQEENQEAGVLLMGGITFNKEAMGNGPVAVHARVETGEDGIEKVKVEETTQEGGIFRQREIMTITGQDGEPARITIERDGEGRILSADTAKE